MAQPKKRTFIVKVPIDPENKDNKETKDVELHAKTPTIDDVNKAQMAYNQGLDSAIRSKAPLRIEVETLLKERGIWNEIKETQFNEKREELDKLIHKLVGGGIKLSEAREIALDIREKRAELSSLNQPRRILDLSTAESQAEQARFNWFVANCVVYADTGERFFTDEKDYLERSNTDYAMECAKQFSMLQYGVDPDAEKRLEENVFLLKFKFVRESDLRLVDRNGNLIDRKGRFIDEEGYLLDKPKGNRVDHNGAPLDKEGKLILEKKPYFDESGNPVEELVTT